MKYLLLSLSIIMFSITATAQIAQGGEPLNWIDKTVSQEINFIKMPALDMTPIIEEDAVVDQYKETPYRYGIEKEVDFDLFEEGTFVTLENGDRLWKLGLDCPEATSINLIFGEFYLPQGGELFVYNEAKDEYLGAFTDANNKSYGSLAIGVIHSDRIILEYREPVSEIGQTLLNISHITHGYRAVLNKFEADKGPFGNSGSCNMNVNCPDGDPWENQARGVALILNNGSAWCTGSLINNTAQDGSAYFLTAAHCDGNENNWVFYFNHQYAGCTNSGSAPTNQSISGGTQLASISSSDAHLVELSSAPPQSYNPYYNGWDKSGNALSSVVGIHHPAGDVKKISFDDDPLQKTNYLSGTVNSNGTHWQVEQWERNTTTEGGSSGSPIFDENQRIVGQLHGGFASCSSFTADWYGAMDKSFPTLSAFLDPGNTGALTLNGLDPFSAPETTTYVLKTNLKGPYNSGSGTMNDDLRQLPSFPTTEPFTGLGFNHVLGGGETITNNVLLQTGNNAIVDWIFVEIRAVNGGIIETKSCLLQRDGDIVDVDGSIPVVFENVNQSTVQVAIRHRNHFGVRTLDSFSTTSTVNIDFTDPSVTLFGGTAAMETIGGVRVMISGDANADGNINSVDNNLFWRAQNGNPFSYSGSSADFDLNGTVNTVDKNIHWRSGNGLSDHID